MAQIGEAHVLLGIKDETARGFAAVTAQLNAIQKSAEKTGEGKGVDKLAKQMGDLKAVIAGGTIKDAFVNLASSFGLLSESGAGKAIAGVMDALASGNPILAGVNVALGIYNTMMAEAEKEAASMRAQLDEQARAMDYVRGVAADLAKSYGDIVDASRRFTLAITPTDRMAQAAKDVATLEASLRLVDGKMVDVEAKIAGSLNMGETRALRGLLANLHDDRSRLLLELKTARIAEGAQQIQQIGREARTGLANPRDRDMQKVRDEFADKRAGLAKLDPGGFQSGILQDLNRLENQRLQEVQERHDLEEKKLDDEHRKENEAAEERARKLDELKTKQLKAIDEIDGRMKAAAQMQELLDLAGLKGGMFGGLGDAAEAVMRRSEAAQAAEAKFAAPMKALQEIADDAEASDEARLKAKEKLLELTEAQADAERRAVEASDKLAEIEAKLKRDEKELGDRERKLDELKAKPEAAKATIGALADMQRQLQISGLNAGLNSKQEQEVKRAEEAVRLQKEGVAATKELIKVTKKAGDDAVRINFVN